MPAYVVKVTLQGGWLLPPISANCESEAEAVELVKSFVDESVAIEVKGIRPDVMIAAYGDQPEGTAVIRGDWTWKGESDDIPTPYAT